MYIVLSDQNGVKTNRMVKDYMSESYDTGASVKIIGVGGVVVASKEPGQEELTVNQ